MAKTKLPKTVFSEPPLQVHSSEAKFWWGALPLLLAAAWMWPLAVSSELARWLLSEDGFFESASAMLFFGAGTLLVFTWIKRRRFVNSAGFLLLGLLMMFTAGEEISWGQRIFEWSTPVGFDNIQRETTIHNHRWFDRRTAGWLSMSHMFEYFCLAYGVVLPIVASRVAWVGTLVRRLGIPIAPLVIGAFFPTNYIISKLYQATTDAEWIFDIAELRECTHALVWFMLSCIFFMSQRPFKYGSN